MASMGKKSANARVSIVHGEESSNARDSVTSEINWTCMACKSLARRHVCRFTWYNIYNTVLYYSTYMYIDSESELCLYLWKRGGGFEKEQCVLFFLTSLVIYLRVKNLSPQVKLSWLYSSSLKPGPLISPAKKSFSLGRVSVYPAWCTVQTLLDIRLI